MSLITDIADEVITELNEATLSQAFTAERRYAPIFDLEEMTDLKVSVVPRSKTSSAGTRAQREFTVEIDIAVQKKVPAEDLTTPDALMTLVEEIADLFRMKRLTTSRAAWTAEANDPIFLPGHIRRLGQFTSVLTLTFAIVK